MGKYSSIDDVKRAVDENFGLLTVEMKELRDIYARERLGAQVRERIKQDLAKVGISYQSEKAGDALPRYQDDLVRLYRKDSPAQALIEAARHPGKAADNLLWQALVWVKMNK